MTDQDHVELLEIFKKHTGFVMISGYESELYNNLLEGWHTEKLMAKCEGGQERQEVLWMNYRPQGQTSMF